MRKYLASVIAALLSGVAAMAQYVDGAPESGVDTAKVVISLDDALRIALSENVSVKVADLEVTRSEYAKRGTYAALFPQINASGSYQRTIKKQVMYMGGSSGDDDGEGGGGGMASMFTSAFEPIMYYIQELMKQHPGAIAPYVPAETTETSTSSDNGFEVGRLNTYSAGINAVMPLVNLQLWESMSLSADQVEMAVEKARESRLGTVSSVKQAYYAVLLAKEAFEVYRSVYENAIENYRQTEMRYNAQKASELDFTRAKSNVAAAIPNVYNAESGIALALWQLKAVMGIDLDTDIDTEGSLQDYGEHMFYDIHEHDDPDFRGNSSMRQLAMQAEQLAKTIRMQQYAYLPSLNLSFAYSFNAMTDDFEFSNYRWTPYSYVGISLSIPIFSGGQRYYNVKQTRVQAAELEYQRVNAERQLQIAVRQSLQTMETAMKTYDAAKDALQSAEKAYDIARKSYLVGRSTLTDLSNTELVLTQSRLSVSQAIYSFVVAKTALEQTLGYDFTEENETPQIYEQ